MNWYWKVTKWDDFGEPVRRVKVFRKPTFAELYAAVGEALL